jgi:hypothetical protein
LSTVDSFPGNTAKNEVAELVTRLAAADPQVLLKSHRDWWHAFYPENFISIPDQKLESFYWIQWYKLASASPRIPARLISSDPGIATLYRSA